MQITRTSMLSGTIRTRDIDCTQKQIDDWRDGTKAQDAFPQLSASDREFIMTGITDEEWKEMSEEPEENEED